MSPQRFLLVTNRPADPGGTVITPGPPVAQEQRLITLGTSPPSPTRAAFQAQKDLFAPAPLTQAMYFSQAASDPIIFSSQVGDVQALDMEPHVSWSGAHLDTLADGTHEGQWTTIGYRLQALGQRTMWVRPNHEFNNRSDSSSGPPSETPAEFIAGWRYVAHRLRSMSSSVRLVWSPNYWTGADIFDDPVAYYPGDDYVDAIGLDGYMNQRESRAKTFESIFMPDYTTLCSISTKPFWVAEVGCTSLRGDTSQPFWITQMWETIRDQMPRVSHVNYWQREDWQMLPESLPWFRNGYAAALNSPGITELPPPCLAPGPV